MDTSNSNIQFSTPHSSPNSKAKIAILAAFVVFAILAVSGWYFFSKSMTDSSHESAVLVPPTDEEKALLASSLSERRPNISNDDKDVMMQELEKSKAEVTVENRNSSIESLINN